MTIDKGVSCNNQLHHHNIIEDLVTMLYSISKTLYIRVLARRETSWLFILLVSVSVPELPGSIEGGQATSHQSSEKV